MGTTTALPPLAPHQDDRLHFPLPIRPARVPMIDDEEPHAAARIPVAMRRTPVVDLAPGELDLAHRVLLADRIALLLVDADRYHRGDTAPARAVRAQVVGARGRLRDLEHALRSGIPLTRRGERLVERLVANAAMGTYVGHGDRRMHDDAEVACLAIGSVSPFH